ncbi:leucyl aminopeptidase [Roseisolibacter sp. H3M3-2]|uniref:leucyl aminopeptidase n=1 Tax=Roseisolibacter sp. H3M3-2 TaxID=3031323 RepID=UPI0023DA1153|nr:leucyl aminopeptidase [Roseisolibacter sp. H3M3-2]MDF1503711.1 leucyl aminopeptidase [Roseisolibacter sp. H3M3-2]
MPLQFALSVDAPHALSTPLLAVALAADEALPGALSELDARLGGALGRTLARRDFRGGRDETLHLAGGDDGVQRVLLVGLGKAADRPGALRRAGAVAARAATKLGTGELAFYAAGLDARGAEEAAVGMGLGAWSYDDLRAKPPEKDRRAQLSRVTVVGDAALQPAIDAADAVNAGYATARRLAMMPGNVCTPDTFAQVGREIADAHGLSLTVLGRAEMEAEGMGSFLSVAQGTPQDPKLVALEYRKGGDAKPIVLVGKGLCFDTGGINLKPGEGMFNMKFDMCGAAGVMGAMEAIARLGLAVNVVGVIGSTTNMPSGEAMKPGDVVRAMSGKTIENHNTDAEGRLVLCDLLHWVKKYEPAAVIDAATLTGAIVIALGHQAVGVFGSDDALTQEVLAAGRRASERGWELPMFEEYKEQLKSDVADLKNVGGRAAGSITAAWFLREFVDGAYPWVHLDVAGTAYSETDLGWLPKGPTGTPTGTFIEFVRGRAG